MSAADFSSLIAQILSPTDSIPPDIKSNTMTDLEYGDIHHEDSQQRHFQSHQLQPSNKKQHRYPLRSKSPLSVFTSSIKDTFSLNWNAMNEKVKNGQLVNGIR